jgi:hypothetical protein
MKGAIGESRELQKSAGPAPPPDGRCEGSPGALASSMRTGPAVLRIQICTRDGPGRIHGLRGAGARAPRRKRSASSGRLGLTPSAAGIN